MCITGPHGEWLVLFACWNQVSHNLFSNMILQRKTYKQRSWQLSSVGISEPGSRFLLCRGLRESVHQKGEPLEGAPGMMFGDRNMGEWSTPPPPTPHPHSDCFIAEIPEETGMKWLAPATSRTFSPNFDKIL